MGQSPFDTANIGISAFLLFLSTMLIGGGMLIWAWVDAFATKARGSLLYAFTVAVLIPYGIVTASSVFHVNISRDTSLFILVLGSLCLSYAFVVITAIASPRGTALRIASRVLLGFTTLPFIMLTYSVSGAIAN